MYNRLYKLTLIHPAFEELYEKFEKSFGLNQQEQSAVTGGIKSIVFPPILISKLPNDVRDICNEFNFNFNNNHPLAAMLLLRRLLPLCIVRKFQKLGKENDIKDGDDYLETKNLLGKIENYLKEKKVYRELLNYKILTDSSQHSYTFFPELSDVQGAALKIRLILEDLFV